MIFCRLFFCQIKDLPHVVLAVELLKKQRGISVIDLHIYAVIAFCLLDPSVRQDVLTFQMRNTGIGIVGKYCIMLLANVAFCNDKAGRSQKNKNGSCNKGRKQCHMDVKFPEHDSLLNNVILWTL